MLYPILLAVSLALGVAGDIYDVILTEKGLKAGVAAEGNQWLSSIVGTKPSAVGLYFRDSIVLALCVAPTALCATVFHNLPLAYGALAGPVAYGAKHVLGGLQWRTLLNGGKLPTVQTAWQKFLNW